MTRVRDGSLLLLQLYTNFTEGLSTSDWTLNLGVNQGPTVSPAIGQVDTPVRPGFVRMTTPGDRIYDCWNFRGDCPFLLRKETLMGSWTMETMVETAVNEGFAITGLVVYDANGWSWNGYR